MYCNFSFGRKGHLSKIAYFFYVTSAQQQLTDPIALSYFCLFEDSQVRSCVGGRGCWKIYLYHVLGKT